MPWGHLRSNLLADLGFTSPDDLAAAINFDDVEHVAAALNGSEPRDELMTALLRHYITTPVLYFVDSAPAA